MKRSRISGISRAESFRTDSESGMGDMDDDNKNNKRVNRNMSEKKRRDQFNVLVNELCSMVSTTTKKMDKSTVLKSTIAFLRNYQETTVQAQAHEIKEDWKPSFLSNDEFTHLMLEALDSCLFVFTQQGHIMYASESVSSLLGHLPDDLVNKPVYDFIHENEKQNLYNMLFHFSMMTPEELEKEKNQLSFSCHFQRASLSSEDKEMYEAVRFTGFRHWNAEKLGGSMLDDDGSLMSQGAGRDGNCFCCTVRLQNSQFIREMSIVDEAKSEFTSRHSLEWKFLFLDHRASPIIGYLPFEVLGTSGYDYYHPDDLEKLAKCHEQLMMTGEGMSCFYRFLTKGQQWIWLRSRYYITYHQWNSKPEFIVCTNTVVSYAKVRKNIRREMGFEDDKHSTANDEITCATPRSPSACSVTSGGNRTSDRESVESMPHSTFNKDLPQSVTPQLHRLLQQRFRQQREQQPEQQPISTQTIAPQGAAIIPGAVLAGNTRIIAPTFSDGKPSNAPSTASPSPVILPAARIATPDTVTNQQQLHLTPIQKQLQEQLKEKHKKLQAAILKQQEELQQITQQLALASQGNAVPILPVTPVAAPVMVAASPTLTPFTVPSTIQSCVPMIPVQSQPITFNQQFMPFQLVHQDADFLLCSAGSSTTPPLSSI